MIIFKYKQEPGRLPGHFIFRPVAEIHLQAKQGGWIKLNPYIDSGADVTLIPLSLGKLLGLEIEKNKIEEIGGIKGSIPIIYDKVKMKIGEFNLPVQIACALIEEIPPLLGREDIFDFFHITFKQNQGIITFEKL